MGSYTLKWFSILTFRYDPFSGENEVPKNFVVYGVGQADGHIMDWAGCNFHHGRIPGSPVFKSVEEAMNWLREKIWSGELYGGQTLKGHHSGEYECSKGCDDREVSGHEQVPFLSFGKKVKFSNGKEEKEIEIVPAEDKTTMSDDPPIKAFIDGQPVEIRKNIYERMGHFTLNGISWMTDLIEQKVE